MPVYLLVGNTQLVLHTRKIQRDVNYTVYVTEVSIVVQSGDLSHARKKYSKKQEQKNFKRYKPNFKWYKHISVYHKTSLLQVTKVAMQLNIKRKYLHVQIFWFHAYYNSITKFYIRLPYWSSFMPDKLKYVGITKKWKYSFTIIIYVLLLRFKNCSENRVTAGMKMECDMLLPEILSLLSL
mgnify:CR=1 FL=1